MDDIVPGLYKTILGEFENKVMADAWIKAFDKRVKDGTAAQEEADSYAERLGKYAAAALIHGLSPDNLPDGKIYWNIAKRTVEPLLRRVHAMVSDAMVSIIETQHKKIRLGTKPVRAPFNQDRCDAIMNKIVKVSLGEDNGGTEESGNIS